jgi:hypothetical protein
MFMYNRALYPYNPYVLYECVRVGKSTSNQYACKRVQNIDKNRDKNADNNSIIIPVSCMIPTFLHTKVISQFLKPSVSIVSPPPDWNKL